jgi:hypothetical protein
MQFDLADRVITQYSMEGETVFDPFSGLGTVAIRSLKLRRKGLGIELNERYFRDSVFYCKAEELKLATPSLFDALPELDGDTDQVPIDVLECAQPESLLADSTDRHLGNYGLHDGQSCLSGAGHE